MHFCSKCGNMYYIKLETSSDALSYYCRKCGFEDETISANVKNLCVSKTHISDNANVYSQVINKYTKLDPTLPRVNNLKCPNKDCLTNSSDESKVKEREIIYIRYDDKNMKYVYLCSECDHVWKT